MIIEGSELEVHHTRTSHQLGVWFFTCDDCSFEANYTPNSKRFEIVVCGNPFARHVCHHKLEEAVGVRQLINEMDVVMDEMEVEF